MGMVVPEDDLPEELRYGSLSSKIVPNDDLPEELRSESTTDFLTKKVQQGSLKVAAGATFVAGGLADIFGSAKKSDELFKTFEELQKASADKELGVGTYDESHNLPTRVLGGVASAIPQLAGFLVNPTAGILGSMSGTFADTGDNVKEGMDVGTAGAILAVDAVANIVGYKVPSSLGGSVAKKIASGVGINVGLGAVGDTAKQALASDTPELAAKYDPTNIDARVTDALFGAIAGKGGKTKHVDSLDNMLKEVDARETPKGNPFTQEPKDMFQEDMKTPYGTKTGESPDFQVDENGIPINRKATDNVQQNEIESLNKEFENKQAQTSKVVDLKLDPLKEEMQQFVDTNFNSSEKTPINNLETPKTFLDEVPGVNEKPIRFGNKQGGFINPAIAREGVASLLNKFKPEGVLMAFRGTFSPKSINDMRNIINDPNSKSSVVWMKPKDFKALADDRPANFNDGFSQKKRDSIKQGLNTDEGLKQTPYLSVDDKGNVLTHNGRHRMDVLEKEGVDLVPVEIKNLPKGAPIDFLTPQKNAASQDKIMLGNRIESSSTKNNIDSIHFSKPNTIGGVGKSAFGQGGAINLTGLFKSDTLESKAKTLNVLDWTSEFLEKYPQYQGKPEVAAEMYKRLNPLSESNPQSVKEFLDNSETLQGLDHYLGVASTRIGNISESILHRAIRFEKDLLVKTHSKIDVANTFLKEINSLSKNDINVVNNLLFNNKTDQLINFLNKKGKSELSTEYSKIRVMLDSVGEELTIFGKLTNLRQDYFPRIVKDVAGLLKHLGMPEKNPLQDLLTNAERKATLLGKQFTETEQSKIINDYLRTRKTTQYKAGFTKERKIDDITPDMEKFYASPTEALHTYLQNAINEIETAKFFGRDKVIDPETSKIDINKSIGEIVARNIREGKMPIKKTLELESLLKSRFGPGNQASNKLIQGFKDLSNIGLLGSVTSAITQGADLGSSIYMNGLTSTIMSLQAQIQGKSKVTMKDYGLTDHISQEFVSQRTSSKALNKVFKTTGFQLMDSIGKTTLLDSTIRRAETLVKSKQGLAKFESTWGKRFGEEFPTLVKDLQANRRTELTDMLAFSQLSKVQPITKLEQTQAGLNSPNGRILYMLKSFMIKQMDLLRNESYQKMKSGNTKEGIGNLLRYSFILGSAGATTGYVKDWIMGREIDPALSDIPLNVLKMFSLNEYNIDKIKKGEVVDVLMKSIIPPYKMFDDIVKDIWKSADGDPTTKASRKWIKYLPGGGNIYYERIKNEH